MSRAKWLCVPDMQVPDHDRKLIDRVIGWADGEGFTGILCVGDELDAPEPSRWQKNFAGEHAGTLQKSIDECHTVLEGLASVIPADAPFYLSRSNHGERIQTYVRRYADALSSLRSLEYQTLLGLEELGITYVDKPYEFAPGWVLCHGDEGGGSQVAGGVALGLARKFGKSVLAGHTHKAGLIHQHTSVGGRMHQYIFGMEIGHWMDMRKASYLKGGTANWQQAIGIIEVDGKNVFPQLIPIINGKW